MQGLAMISEHMGNSIGNTDQSMLLANPSVNAHSLNASLFEGRQ